MSDAQLPPPPEEPPAFDDPGSPGGAGTRAGSSNGSRGYDRVPPHSLEAEVSVLGAAMLSRAAGAEAVESLRPEDFYRGAHRTVFEAIVSLIEANEPIDTVTLTDWLARRGRLDEVGGPAALHDLTVATPTAANAAYYAEIVRQKALLRRLIDAGTSVARLGYEAVEDAEVVVDRAESLIYEVAQGGGAANQYSQLRDLLNDSFEAIERLAEQSSEVTGLATGFDDLDRLTSGLQPQNLIILAARPAMGKCLGSCRVTDVKSGAWTSIEELVERGRDGEAVQIAALDEQGRLVPADVSEFHDNGVRPVWRLRTRSGRAIRATANHPFRTWEGWRELGDLAPGDRIAVPRELPYFGDQPLTDAEVILVGYLLGDGCLRAQAPALTTMSETIARDAAAAGAAFGTEARVTEKRGSLAWTLAFRPAHARVTLEDVAQQAEVLTYRAGVALRSAEPMAEDRRIREVASQLGYTGHPKRNHLQERLAELGLVGRGSHDKFVPEPFFRLPREQVALFLSRLYATDGSAWVTEKHGYFGVSYTSVSERLIRDVQHLLLRFGILSRIRERRVRYREGTNRAYELEIRDADNVRRFCTEIGIFSKEEQVARVLEFAERRTVSHTNTDLLPVEIWELVAAEKGDRSWADVSAATGRPRSHNWHVGQRSPSRRLVAELAEALDSQPLRDAATSDVLWDEVVAIEPAGEERVYDLTVPGLHNFVADDLIVHNSSMVLNLAQYVTVELKKPAIIFSLEMSKLEIVNRMLSGEARIESTKLRTGKLDDLDWRKLSDALGRLSDAPLFIDDTPSITLMEIRAKCRRLKQREGLDLVIVDYLQLMSSHARVDSRQQEVAEFSRGLKMLAKELDVPVIALSQLSRQPESRTDKRPMMSDLRESGSLEQDADIVAFIYRDEVYDEDTPDKGIAELIVSKHRNGATGVVKLAFLNHLTKFANLARGPGSGGGGGGGGASPI